MTDSELIDELTALYESCSDTATAAALDQVLIRLERRNNDGRRRLYPL